MCGPEWATLPLFSLKEKSVRETPKPAYEGNMAKMVEKEGRFYIIFYFLNIV